MTFKFRNALFCCETPYASFSRPNFFHHLSSNMSQLSPSVGGGTVVNTPASGVVASEEMADVAPHSSHFAIDMRNDPRYLTFSIGLPIIDVATATLEYDFSKHETVELARQLASSVILASVTASISQVSVEPLQDTRARCSPYRFGLCDRRLPIADANKHSVLDKFPFLEHYTFGTFQPTHKSVTWISRTHSNKPGIDMPGCMQLDLRCSEYRFGWPKFVFGRVFTSSGEDDLAYIHLTVTLLLNGSGPQIPLSIAAPTIAALDAS